MTKKLSKTSIRKIKSKSVKKPTKVSLDKIMLQTWHNLIIDLLSFNTSLQTDLLQKKSGTEIREVSLPGYMNSTPYLFKKLRQIESFNKRYIYKDDLWSLEELETLTEAEFVANQKTYGLPFYRSTACNEVLERARCIVYDIVGEFDFVTFSQLCRFGKRASLGVKRKEANLFQKTEVLSYTSERQLRCYMNVIKDDKILSEITAQKPTFMPSINYTTVPKTYKTSRGIAPDSVIGGFLSQGLGTYLRLLLEERTHINLATAKEQHMRLAKKSSVDRLYATIDMSQASDSFVWEHVTKLFPRSWWDVLQDVRSGTILIREMEAIELKSYMLMGSGHTFPMQTIMFYALAEAVRQLTNTRGKVLTFGDDILLPTRCASVFCKIMPSLGFKINPDKSFFRNEKFRESCGGDYYGGYDVRPVMPKGNYKPLDKIEYCASCYKILNRLLATWSFYEIPVTVAKLHAEIEKQLGFVQRGDKLTDSEFSSLLYDIPLDVRQPKFLMAAGGTIARQASLITVTISKGTYGPEKQLPFYWEKLTGPKLEEIHSDIITPLTVGERLESYLDQMRIFDAIPEIAVEKRTQVREKLALIRRSDFRHKPRYKLKVVTTPSLRTRVI